VVAEPPGSTAALSAPGRTDRLFRRGAFADQVADHGKASGNANADRKCRASCPDCPHRVDHRQPGTNRAFSIGFIGARPAEIDQHTVAHVAGDEPALLLHGVGDATLIAGHQLSQIFRIALRGQCRGADQVAEHDAKLAAFSGYRRPRRRGR